MNFPQDIPSMIAMLKSQAISLAHYQFSIHNVVFWLAILILFAVLAVIWDTRKSLSFCSLVALLLLATTKIETYIVNYALKGGETFDPTIVKLLSLVALAFITIYYAFIAKDR